MPSLMNLGVTRIQAILTVHLKKQEEGIYHTYKDYSSMKSSGNYNSSYNIPLGFFLDSSGCVNLGRNWIFFFFNLSETFSNILFLSFLSFIVGHNFDFGF
jgi:hypothetical protein